MNSTWTASTGLHMIQNSSDQVAGYGPCGHSPVNPSQNIYSSCFSETANTLYGTMFLFAAVLSFIGKPSTNSFRLDCNML